MIRCRAGAVLLLIALPAPADGPDAPAPRVDRDGVALPPGVLARMGSGRFRAGVHCRLQFTPDGKTLLTGGRGRLRLWDMATWRLKQRLDLGSESAFGFAAAGAEVATADGRLDDGLVSVRRFDPATGKAPVRVRLAERAGNYELVFSRAADRIAVGHEKAVGVYDTADGGEVCRVPVPNTWAGDYAFTPDGKALAVCDFTDTVRLYDATTGRPLRDLRREGDEVICLAVSPDGRFLASIPGRRGAGPAEVSVWDLATGRERSRLQNPGHAGCTAFSPDGRFLAVGGVSADLVLWDLATGKEARRFRVAGYVHAAVFSPDGRTLAASTGEGVVCLWDVATGDLRPASADPMVDEARDLRYSADGRRLTANAGVFLTWDPRTGREVRRTPWVSRVAGRGDLSPDGTLLAGVDNGTEGGTIRLSDAATGRELRTLAGHDKGTWTVRFAPDGRRLVSAGQDAAVRVWDVAAGRELRRLDAPDERTQHLTVSPDGRHLAAGGGRRGPTVLVWDLATGREVARCALDGGILWGVAFSPDGGRLAVAGGEARRGGPGLLKVWDVAANREAWAAAPPGKWFVSAAFSPDGRTLATGRVDGELALYEAATGARRCVLPGHETWVQSLAFAPDGRTLAASSCEAPVYVWEVAGVTPVSRPGETDLSRLRADLSSADAAAGFRAVRQLAAAPEAAVPYLRSHLRAEPPADAARVAKLIADLDGERFDSRDAAEKELDALGEAAAPGLRKALAGDLSPGARRRVAGLLRQLETGSTPGQLRATRAVEALEYAGTADARKLLAEWSAGSEGARLTVEAKAALGRLELRAKP